MGAATRTISSAKDFQRVLNTPRPVFMLFVSEHCPACASAVPLFEKVAWQHPWIVSMVLDCAHTPRHPDVTGTPTLLVYERGNQVELHKGFGAVEQQQAFVEALFSLYDRSKAATAPASPVVLQSPPPLVASPHVPGYRPPQANDRAGSSAGQPAFDSPR